MADGVTSLIVSIVPQSHKWLPEQSWCRDDDLESYIVFIVMHDISDQDAFLLYMCGMKVGYLVNRKFTYKCRETTLVLNFLWKNIPVSYYR